MLSIVMSFRSRRYRFHDRDETKRGSDEVSALVKKVAEQSVRDANHGVGH
jgi:hypothetical protein